MVDPTSSSWKGCSMVSRPSDTAPAPYAGTEDPETAAPLATAGAADDEDDDDKHAADDDDEVAGK